MLVYIIVAYLVMQAGSGLQAPAWADAAASRFGIGAERAAAPAPPCGYDMPVRDHMADSISPQLRKLAEYEQVCEAAFADEQMLFSATPTTPEEALRVGNAMATSLKEFDAYSVHPLVILEPVAPDGRVLSMAEAAKGTYDEPMRAYYKALQNRGVTDAMMGTWVPFPEANTPVWVQTDPSDFAAAVTRMVRVQKEAFAASKASILLASQSYPSDDAQWVRGGFASLKPYIKNIPDGLIDSFGYQGFPWVPPANKVGYPLTDATQFLRTDYAAEAAEDLGVRSIWFNTGTFDRAHTATSASQVAMDAAERKRILLGALDQARILRQNGFEVAINIFAEDKSAMGEAIDWSYWPAGQAASSELRPVFQSFVERASGSNIGVGVYDDDHKGAGVISESR